jgi:hypothetical protein
MRETVAPDPNRTLTDSIAAENALAKAIPPKSPASTHPVVMQRRRPVFIAKHQETDPSGPASEDWFGWRFPEEEVDEDLLACYGKWGERSASTNQEEEIDQFCWTCWLRGHFSEDCPIVPAHLRPEIAARRKVEMVMKRQRESRLSNCKTGWYQPQGDQVHTDGQSNSVPTPAQTETLAIPTKTAEGGTTRPSNPTPNRKGSALV